VTLLAVWLHVLAIVVWIGGLVYQSHVIVPAARDVASDAARIDAAIDALRRARPMTWTAIGLAVLTGFYNVTRLGPLERVMESGAGLLLAGKFVLVLLAVALFGQRDFAQVPRLTHAHDARESVAGPLAAITWLDRSVLALAVVIIYLGLAVARKSG
jgi:uncharacterized membrane protein